MINSDRSFFKNAPRFLLGAFLLFGLFSLPVLGQEAPEPVAPADAPEAEAKELRFMAYNLENYLTMTRYVKGGEKVETSKDPKEIEALVKIIVAEKPDILGICEIGTEADLKDLQTRLKNAGLDLPHSVHAGGSDTTRHLGLLSTLPIAANNSQKELVYQISGHERMVSRGILSVTIDLPGGSTHFVGLHLKSKRELKEFDQAEIRLHEARLAREHCEAIMEKDPEARIVLYGDMNDTRKTPPLSMLMGRFKSKTYLGDVFAKDSRGHLWTHYWSYQQQYSRFDWVLVSPSVYPDVDQEKSYIVDPDNWNEASDHRAILMTLKK